MSKSKLVNGKRNSLHRMKSHFWVGENICQLSDCYYLEISYSQIASQAANQIIQLHWVEGSNYRHFPSQRRFTNGQQVDEKRSFSLIIRKSQIKITRCHLILSKTSECWRLWRMLGIQIKASMGSSMEGRVNEISIQEFKL